MSTYQVYYHIILLYDLRDNVGVIVVHKLLNVHSAIVESWLDVVYVLVGSAARESHESAKGVEVSGEEGNYLGGRAENHHFESGGGGTVEVGVQDLAGDGSATHETQHIIWTSCGDESATHSHKSTPNREECM